MKIAILQECGHHQINMKYREALCIENAFKQLGHECIVWGDRYRSFYSNTFDQIEKWCDILFIVENYFYHWLPIEQFNQSQKIKLFWTIDSHVTFARHENLTKQIKFDHIFTSTKKFIHNYYNCSWLPNCYPEHLCKPIDGIQKNIRFGFCGSAIPSRLSILNLLTQKYGLQQDFYVLGDHMVDQINRYYLHFNRNINYDINYRTFETTGCRTALVTNYTDNLEELFDLDKDLLVYHNDDQLFEILDKYLYEDKYLDTIANNGYNNASNNHTYYNRCQQIIKTIQ